MAISSLPFSLFCSSSDPSLILSSFSFRDFSPKTGKRQWETIARIARPAKTETETATFPAISYLERSSLTLKVKLFDLGRDFRI